MIQETILNLETLESTQLTCRKLNFYSIEIQKLQNVVFIFFH